MTEPIKLHCQAGGSVRGDMAWDGDPDETYIIKDLPGGSVPTINPVGTAATGLFNDGWPPTTKFALQTYPEGRTLFIGSIGDHIIDRRELALRSA